MPWKDLGEVVGKNGTIGNVDSTYVNNGGEPGVSVTKSGDDSAPDLTFEFENLVNDPLTSSEIEQISNDTQLTSSSVLNGTGLTTLWSRIKAKFAPKSHTHDASDITAGELAATLIANGLITEEMLHDGAVTGDKIANGSITKDKLEKTFGDSLYQDTGWENDWVQTSGNYEIDVRHRIVSGTVYLSAKSSGIFSLAPNTWKTITTLPESVRPDREICAAGSDYTGIGICVRITTDGLVLACTGKDTPYWTFGCSWPV